VHLACWCPLRSFPLLARGIPAEWLPVTPEERRKAAELQKGAVRKGFVPAALMVLQGSPLDRCDKTSTAVPLQRSYGPLISILSTPKSPHVNAAHP